MNIGQKTDASKLPRIYYVNWFRRGEDGRFLWPGFGENSRVLKWITERIEGKASAHDTAIGRVPSAADLDLSGLETPEEDVNAALAVNDEEWKAEIPLIEEWFDKIGDALPASMKDELAALKKRLGL